MNELIIKENVDIENMIYEVRVVQVMLDSDLAKLYECANGTKTINLAVKRHINRFPKDFYFQLTHDEYYEILRSQIGTANELTERECFNLKSQLGTSSWNDYGGVRKIPYLFTEQGVAMLAAVLKSDLATKVSIAIIDAYADNTIIRYY